MPDLDLITGYFSSRNFYLDEEENEKEE